MIDNHPILSFFITLCIGSLVSFFIGFKMRDFFTKKKLLLDVHNELNQFLRGKFHRNAVVELIGNNELQREWRELTDGVFFPKGTKLKKEFIDLKQKVRTYFECIEKYNDGDIPLSDVSFSRREARAAWNKLSNKLDLELQLSYTIKNKTWPT